MSRGFSVRLRLPCPRPVGDRVWGDWYFGLSLARAIEALDHRVEIEPAPSASLWRRWFGRRRSEARATDIDLVLRGRKVHDRVPGKPTLMWLISRSDDLTAAEVAGVDHVFVASAPCLDRLRAGGAGNVSLLLQCTDARLFAPGPVDPALATECLFVGNRREAARPAVEHALALGLPLTVWGRGWENLPAGICRGRHVANEVLGRHYASARVVLNDHTSEMLRDGFVSNRHFDVLASGAPLVTDLVAGLPADLAGAAYGFRDRASFAEAVARARAEGPEARARRQDLAGIVRRDHGFDARAAAIVDRAARLS